MINLHFTYITLVTLGMLLSPIGYKIKRMWGDHSFSYPLLLCQFKKWKLLLSHPTQACYSFPP